MKLSLNCRLSCRKPNFIVCPANEPKLLEEAREAGCRVAVFSTGDLIGEDALEVATVVARVRDGAIWVEHCGDGERAGPLRGDLPATSQVAAALAAYVLRDSGMRR